MVDVVGVAVDVAPAFAFIVVVAVIVAELIVARTFGARGHRAGPRVHASTGGRGCSCSCGCLYRSC